MEIARAINHFVLATQGVAHAIIACAAVLVLFYLADREPPFAVVSVAPTAARPGEYVTLDAAVKRDATRGCNAEFSRYVFDSAGARFDMGHSIASAEMITAMDRATPGRLVISARIPEAAKPGPASLQTVLEYKCNRTHHFWPITTTVEMPFTVLP